MRPVATITQLQGTPAALVESLPFSGSTTRVAGTPRSLVGDGPAAQTTMGDVALPAWMMVATGMPRSARSVAMPLLTRRDLVRIAAVAALASLVAMMVAGMGRMALGDDAEGAGSKEPGSEELAPSPLPMALPMAPECPAAEPTPLPPRPPEPRAMKPPPETSATKPPPVSSEPFVIPSALPPIPGLPELAPED